MAEHEWIEEFPVAITVCDKEGLILEMNEAAETFFKKDGGPETHRHQCPGLPSRKSQRKI